MADVTLPPRVSSIQACFHLMERYEMLEHIRAHSVMVAKVARVIARSLKREGMTVSVSKTTVGALLHDIGKTASLTTGGDHAEMGRLICIENRFPEVADIVGEHVKIKHYSPEADLSEKEIVQGEFAVRLPCSSAKGGLKVVTVALSRDVVAYGESVRN